ncbi:unnamed protein product [Danaus chrysippus]|uniref:(African queen) hypothetical protein n=1 Tax=Danaus chrysippus TaxID=151541 RepID=A0A8J2QW48_9NEOP|nr:unnamed protein product [Danaus chrysippus]
MFVLKVSPVVEGAGYWASVECGELVGGAGLQVPQYARLRGVAAGSAAACDLPPATNELANDTRLPDLGHSVTQSATEHVPVQ